MRLFEGTQWDRPPQCERCGRLESECQCPPPEIKPQWADPSTQRVRLKVEKRKQGKVVTVIHGLSATTTDLPGLLVRLKNSLGAGGAVDGDLVELQGSHVERLRTLLQGLGYRV